MSHMWNVCLNCFGVQLSKTLAAKSLCSKLHQQHSHLRQVHADGFLGIGTVKSAESYAKNMRTCTMAFESAVHSFLSILMRNLKSRRDEGLKALLKQVQFIEQPQLALLSPFNCYATSVRNCYFDHRQCNANHASDNFPFLLHLVFRSFARLVAGGC